MKAKAGAAAAAALLLMPALLASVAARPAQQAYGESFDFPPLDRSLVSMLEAGRVAKLAGSSADPEALEAILDAASYDEAALDAGFASLRALADGDPDDVQTAARLAAENFRVAALRANDPEHFRELEELVATLHARAETLPREQAAWTLRWLLRLDLDLHESPPVGGRGTERMLAASRAFVERFAGTEAARHTELDLIGLETPARQNELRVQRLQAFAESHPGSVVGAKALYEAGFTLHVNMDQPRGSDPTERFLRVVAVVDELESGRWPDCKWVAMAPELIIGFYSGLDPVYSPENVTRLLTVYRALLVDHFSVDATRPLQNGIGWVVASRIADLHALQGDRVDGVDAFLAGLEGEITNVEALRWLRAVFLLQEARNALAEDASDDAGVSTHGAAISARDAAAFRERGFMLLEQMERSGSDRWAGKALATAASTLFYERAFEEAADAYQRYLRRWPDSAWAWVATIRLGQSREALGDWDAAAATYRDGARDYAEPAPAAVFANAWAGRAEATQGDFEAAHRYYAAALAAWDDDYGATYRLFTRHAPLATSEQAMVDETDSLTRAALDERVAELDAALASPAGPLLESGRRLLERERWEDADAALKRLIREHPDSPAVPEARYLAHRARFEHALAIADIEAPQPDEASAYERFEELAAEPWDPAVGAAGLAVGAILGKAGLEERAAEVTADALQSWLERQAGYYSDNLPAVAADAALVADVAAIRNVLFRPNGGDFYDNPRGRWNAFDWPTEPPPFYTVDPDMRVTLADDREVRVRVTDPLPDLDNVLFMSAEHRALLVGILDRLGGTETRPPRFIMETPNQPIGASVEILALWKRFFPARPGHWGGWVLQTYPIVGRIEFQDEERSRASVAVGLGYSGCTVHLERTDDGWTVVRLSNFWIT
ncbi:MAG: tetratricopeptide repeat protein [Acidobacteriota bacterium]